MQCRRGLSHTVFSIVSLTSGESANCHWNVPPMKTNSSRGTRCLHWRQLRWIEAPTRKLWSSNWHPPTLRIRHSIQKKKKQLNYNASENRNLLRRLHTWQVDAGDRLFSRCLPKMRLETWRLLITYPFATRHAKQRDMNHQQLVNSLLFLQGCQWTITPTIGKLNAFMTALHMNTSRYVRPTPLGNANCKYNAGRVCHTLHFH